MKKEKRRLVSLLVLLVLALISMNYHYLDNYMSGKFIETQKETAIVVRVIDGDTIEINRSGVKETVRLLGINTPEKNESYYREAKQFINSTLTGKEIFMERGTDDRDRYDRLLRYVFINGEAESINEKIIKEGFANYYFPSGYDGYSYKLIKAFDTCVSDNINFCKKSNDVCADCVELKEFNVKKQEVVIYNICNKECDITSWSIKDEGRKKFIFENYVLSGKREVHIIAGSGKNGNDLLIWERSDYVWNNDHDTLFLRDDKDELVLYKRY